MSTTLRGYLLTLLSAAAFAATSLFLKQAFEAKMNVWNFTFLHSVFSLGLLALLLRREPSASPGGAPRPKTGLVLLYALCGGGSVLLFNLALVYLPISLGSILLFTFPAFVVVGTWLLYGQKPSRLDLGALVLTLAGAVLTINPAGGGTGSGAAHPLGVILALAAAVGHGLYVVLGERVAFGLSAMRATTYTRVAILVGTVLFYPALFAEIPGVSAAGWSLVLIATAVAGVAPFLFLNRGIALIGANRAAIVSVAELPIAMSFGLLFQAEQISAIQWAGAVLIIAAVILSNQGSQDRPATE